ncbi:MAG: YHYH domain-containing protein [Acetivibrio ethanolgignens]
MKKIYYIIIPAILFSILFSSYVTAHPGRTDADGGHYNNNTGEYHYHHGYPEHKHEGGICPYDYVDKTEDSNSDTDIFYNAAYNSKYITNEAADNQLISDLNTTISNLKKNNNELSNSKEFLRAITVFLIIAIIILILICNLKYTKKELEQEKNKIKDELNSQIFSLKEKIEEEKASSLEEISNAYHKGRNDAKDFYFKDFEILDVLRIPKDQQGFLKNHVFGEEIDGSWQNVYIAPNGSRFHEKEDCIENKKKIFIYDAILLGYVPCSKCSHGRKVPDWYLFYLNYIGCPAKNNLRICLKYDKK